MILKSLVLVGQLQQKATTNSTRGTTTRLGRFKLQGTAYVTFRDKAAAMKVGEAARWCWNWPPSPGVLVIGPFLRSILGVVGPKKTGEGIKHHCFFLGGRCSSI